MSYLALVIRQHDDIKDIWQNCFPRSPPIIRHATDKTVSPTKTLQTCRYNFSTFFPFFFLVQSLRTFVHLVNGIVVAINSLDCGGSKTSGILPQPMTLFQSPASLINPTSGHETLSQMPQYPFTAKASRRNFIFSSLAISSFQYPQTVARSSLSLIITINSVIIYNQWLVSYIFIIINHVIGIELKWYHFIAYIALFTLIQPLVDCFINYL